MASLGGGGARIVAGAAGVLALGLAAVPQSEAGGGCFGESPTIVRGAGDESWTPAR